MPESVEDLKKQISRLRMRLVEAQARNYDLRYHGRPEPEANDLKARIDWLESEIKRVISQRDELRKQIGRRPSDV